MKLCSFLKEINLDYSLEGLMLKLKLQSFGHLMWRADSLEKTLMLGEIEGRRRKGATEDEMVGWHHRLNGHEFEQALGVGDGQGSLVCSSPWDHHLNLKPAVLTAQFLSHRLVERGVSIYRWGSCIRFHCRKDSKADCCFKATSIDDHKYPCHTSSVSVTSTYKNS